MCYFGLDACVLCLSTAILSLAKRFLLIVGLNLIPDCVLSSNLVRV